MSTTTTTGTLAAGESRTFTLAPGGAVSLTLSPNVRVTITETPETVSGSGVGGNASRVHEPQLAGTFAYGPYAMGGSVVVAVASNSGSSVAWTRKDTVVTTDSTGTSLVSGDGTLLKVSNQALAQQGFPLVFAPRTTNVAASANCTVTNVERTSKDGQPLWGVRATANASTNCSLDFAFTSTTIASNLVGYLLYIKPPAGLSLDLTFFVSDGPSFTNAYSVTWTFYQEGWYYFCPSKPAESATKKWGVNAGSPSFGSTGFIRTRVRMDYTIGQTPEVEVFGVFEGAKAAKSKLAFVADDGYSSVYSIGAPIFDRYKTPLTCAIIADKIGESASYMTLANLQDLRARGHQITVHGPIGGTGSLLNYSASSDPQRAVYDDVKFHRDYIVSNGLNSDGSERVYVFPQGEFQFGNNDPRIINALKQLDFVGGRWVNSLTLDPMRPVHGYDPFTTIYCAGHAYAGGSEAANITAIISRINEAAASGRDVVIMLHRFVTGTPADALEIQTTNLVLLLEAAQRNVLAGTQECTTLSDVMFAHAGQRLAR